jgi:UDPglucose--hexose-1-phosphate uridylyltransferase
VKPIRKLSATLSDGRDITYFDDANSTLPEDRLSDKREPVARPAIAELRHDPLTNEWISVAAHRHTRAFLPPANRCPLCPTTTDNLSEVPDLFDVVVFENKSPSFGSEVMSENTEPIDNSSKLALGTTRKSIGRCEVVVYSPMHEGSLGTMPVSRVRTVVEALAERTDYLQSLPGVKQVFPFENRGQDIGVTLHHPHGQIYAYPFVTPRTTALLEQIKRFGPNLFQEILEFEKESDRVIYAGEYFTAYVPFAARWPMEIHLTPHRQVRSLVELDASEKDELALIYSKLLAAMETVYETPSPYIAAWHQAPLIEEGTHVRLQLRITSPRRAADRLKYMAGSESAMGAFVADISAESIAQQFREVLK